jgi:hypothetical protein
MKAADQQRPTRRARLRDGHSDAPERRINVERIDGDAITHPALLRISSTPRTESRTGQKARPMESAGKRRKQAFSPDAEIRPVRH